jgi:hypothetical protein
MINRSQGHFNIHRHVGGVPRGRKWIRDDKRLGMVIAKKYKAFKPLNLPNRQWPNKVIDKPPRWLATDLRAPNRSQGHFNIHRHVGGVPRGRKWIRDDKRLGMVRIPQKSIRLSSR